MSLSLARSVLTTDTDSGLVLLDERTGRYWQLNTAGATTLRLLLDGRSAADVAEELTRNTPERTAQALADVRALVRELRNAKLVETGPETERA